MRYSEESLNRGSDAAENIPTYSECAVLRDFTSPDLFDEYRNITSQRANDVAAPESTGNVSIAVFKEDVVLSR